MIRLFSRHTQDGTLIPLSQECFENIDMLRANLAVTASAEYTAAVLEGLQRADSVTVANGDYQNDTYMIIRSGCHEARYMQSQ